MFDGILKKLDSCFYHYLMLDKRMMVRILHAKREIYH